MFLVGSRYRVLAFLLAITFGMFGPTAAWGQDSKTQQSKDSKTQDSKAKADQSSGDSSKDSAGQVDPLKRPLSDKEKKANEKRFKQEVSGSYKKWLDEDVRWIITDEERSAFRQLSNDEERDQFIEAFWQRRDPTPDTIENEFKEEHYRRIAYSNEHFAAGIPGWKTDRGRIYITFGPPDEIDSHPVASAAKPPYEDWLYRFLEGIGNNVSMEFVDTALDGEFHMTMDPNGPGSGRRIIRP